MVFIYLATDQQYFVTVQPLTLKGNFGLKAVISPHQMEDSPEPTDRFQLSLAFSLEAVVLVSIPFFSASGGGALPSAVKQGERSFNAVSSAFCAA